MKDKRDVCCLVSKECRIKSRNMTTSTPEPTNCAWIRADIYRQVGAICSKNSKIVLYHRCAPIPKLTDFVPNTGGFGISPFCAYNL